MTGIAFTAEDRHSSLGIRLDTLLAERLAGHRRANDRDKDPVQTAKIRGRIAEVLALRTILGMDTPSPDYEPDSD